MNKHIYAAAAALVGAGLGSVVTYFAVRKKFDDFANAEIAEVKEYYRLLRKEDVDLDKVADDVATEEAQSEAEKIVRFQEYVSEDVLEEELTNVFEVDEEDPGDPLLDTDYQDILAVRNTEEPYVISKQEHQSAPSEYGRHSLIYYPDDNILIDPSGMVIPNIELVLGPDAIGMFGKCSGAADLVYVRDDEAEDVYEVFREQQGFFEHTDTSGK